MAEVEKPALEPWRPPVHSLGGRMHVAPSRLSMGGPYMTVPTACPGRVFFQRSLSGPLPLRTPEVVPLVKQGSGALLDASALSTSPSACAKSACAKSSPSIVTLDFISGLAQLLSRAFLCTNPHKAGAKVGAGEVDPDTELLDGEWDWKSAESGAAPGESLPSDAEPFMENIESPDFLLGESVDTDDEEVDDESDIYSEDGSDVDDDEAAEERGPVILRANVKGDSAELQALLEELRLLSEDGHSETPEWYYLV